MPQFVRTVMRYWGSSTTCIGDVPVHHPSPIKRRGSPTTHRPSWIIYHPPRTHNPSPIVQLFIVYHPSSNICHACMMHHPWFSIHHQSCTLEWQPNTTKKKRSRKAALAIALFSGDGGNLLFQGDRISLGWSARAPTRAPTRTRGTK